MRLISTAAILLTCTLPSLHQMSVKQLADAIMAAATQEERERILIAHPELQTKEFVNELDDRGEMLVQNGSPARGGELARIALQIAQRINHEPGVAAAYLLLGSALSGQGQNAEAIELLQKGLVIYQAHSDLRDASEALNRIGGAYERMGDRPHAKEFYQKAVDTGHAAGHQINEANAMVNLASILGDERKFDQVIPRLQGCIELYRQAGDRFRMALTMHNLGLTYRDMHKWAESIDYMSRALTEFKSLNSPGRIAVSLRAIGAALALQNKEDEALQYYQESLAISERLGDQGNIASTKFNIADSYRLKGDYPEAIRYYRDSLAIFETQDRRAETARAHRAIAYAYMPLGDYENALEHANLSLAYYTSIGSGPDIARALNPMALSYMNLGNYAAALECYLNQISLARQAKDHLRIKDGLNNLGLLYGTLGDYRLQQQCLADALTLAESEIDTFEIRSNIALGYLQAGSTQRALDLWTALVSELERKDNKDLLSDALLNMSDGCLSQHKYAEALATLNKSIDYRKAVGKSESAEQLETLGKCYRATGRQQQAIEVLERATKLKPYGGIVMGTGNSLLELGNAYRDSGRHADAQAAYQRAITIIERLRLDSPTGEMFRKQFFQQRTEPYRALAEMKAAAQPFEALRYAEQVRGRTLLDTMQGGRPRVAGLSKEEADEEQRRKTETVSLNIQIQTEEQRPQPSQQRLASLMKKRDDARQAYESFRNGLYASHPELRVRRGESPPLNPLDAAKLLQGGQRALIEYLIGDKETLAFVLTEAKGDLRRHSPATLQVHVCHIPVGAEGLAQRVEKLRKDISDPSHAIKGQSRDLYDLLLKPAGLQLAGITSLIIIPDGPLWELPFQAVISPSGRYLVEDVAVSYAPSLTVLREMERPRKTATAGRIAGKVLALGNPALGIDTPKPVALARRGGKLVPLPDAVREVNALKQVYGSSTSQVYIGAEARESRVKADAGKYGILHFATHGTLDDVSPLYSHLVLSQTGNGKDEDGLLEAREIMDLDLHADLAVLSACDTARGKIAPGEGMIGLSWAFFVAGCPCTVVSQWAVLSSPTSAMMVDFHKNLKAGQSKAEALRRASVAIMRNSRYRHPFYWAGFTVIGDAR